MNDYQNLVTSATHHLVYGTFAVVVIAVVLAIVFSILAGWRRW